MHLTPAAEGFITVAWFFPDRLLYYPIAQKALEAAGEQARDALEHLHFEPTEEVPKNAREELVRLVDAGRTMFYGLTNVASPDPGNRTQLKVYREAARQAVHHYNAAARIQKRLRITIHTDLDLDVPFGLVYAQPLDESSPDVGYRGFWAIKHGIAIFPDEPEVDLRIPVNSRAVIATLHRGLYQDAVEATGKGKRWRPEHLCFKRCEVDRAVRVTSSRHRFLYFYAHGHPHGVDLQHRDDDEPDGTVLAASLFLRCRQVDEERRQGESHRRRAFAFVNACRSVLGSERGLPRWASEFLDYDTMSVLIGAEVLVRNRFAWLFGLDFLHDLFTSEEDIAAVFVRMLKKHWPLSLAYTLRTRGNVMFEAGSEVPNPGIESNACEEVARAIRREQ